MITTEFDKLLNGTDPFESLVFTTQSMVLQSGQVVISNVAILNDDYYVMMLPMLLKTQVERGEVTRQLGYLNAGSEDIFMPLRRDQVVCSGSPESALQAFYDKTVDEIMSEENVSEAEVEEVKKIIDKKLH